MTRSFIYTRSFLSCWQAMGLLDVDLIILEETLLENPQKGRVIEGTGGARKLRFGIYDNRGKSSGGRVIYLDNLEKEQIYLLFVYPKSVQANLTAEQKKRLKKLIEEIKKE